MAALVGSNPSADASLSIDLDLLAALAARDGRFASLRALVEAAFGKPIEDERARRESRRGAWNELWQRTAEQVKYREPIHRWLSDANARGWVRRCSGNDIPTA